MLDLEALVSGLRGLADDVAASARETVARRQVAARQLAAAAALPGLRAAAGQLAQDMALPPRDEEIAARVPPEPAEDYTVIAVDGSQIPPDFHHVAPWYVINAGCAVLRYGAPPGRARSRLTSHPVLKPPRRPLAADGTAPGEADARAAAVGVAPQVEVERLKEELGLAARLLEEEADPDRSVLLLDGPLVQWRMINLLQGEDREALARQFGALLERARAARCPIAGVISRSRAVELVTLLRLSLCPEAAVGGVCAGCRETLLERYQEPPADAHHAPLAGLRDVEVAGAHLEGRAGWRTAVFELRSRAWDEISGGAGAAGFFYLHAGPEMARVETPQWVWEDPALLERLHAVLWDQCESGRGYAMALAEAHEAAVVRGPDRAAFYVLIEKLLNEHGFDAAASAKAASKRRPLA